MKMKHIFAAGLVAGVMMAVTGCSTYPAGFSDKSVPVDQGRYTVMGDEVEGSDTQVCILGFGLSMPGSPQRRALKAAMDRSNGADGLVSMAIDQQLINLAVVQIITTRVTGTPVKISK